MNTMTESRARGLLDEAFQVYLKALEAADSTQKDNNGNTLLEFGDGFALMEDFAEFLQSDEFIDLIEIHGAE